jgi:hypothetical protein
MDFWTLFLGWTAFLGVYFKNGVHLDATHSNPDTHMEKMRPLPLDTFGIAGHFFKGRTMDYYIRYPDKPDGAYCSGCHTLKPIADFKRRATLSQARAWLKKKHLKRAHNLRGENCATGVKKEESQATSPPKNYASASSTRVPIH